MVQERLVLLGTGNATVTKCYNTCFAMTSEAGVFLVDTGGGNGILTQLEKAGIPLEDIHDIFISHEHTDHLLGLVWLIRMIATKMLKGSFEGKLRIYCHEELYDSILTICRLTLQKKHFDKIGEDILFDVISDGEERKVLKYRLCFFDIRSTKAKQFGFATTLENGKSFVFVGDEPYSEHEKLFVQNADWLLHEAFCRFADRDEFSPYEKHHSTVKEACEVAESLGVKNLVLYHTEDRMLSDRRRLYTEEGKTYYRGNLLVPDDLDVIEL